MRMKTDRRFGPSDIALVIGYTLAAIVVLLDSFVWRTT